MGRLVVAVIVAVASMVLGAAESASARDRADQSRVERSELAGMVERQASDAPSSSCSEPADVACDDDPFTSDGDGLPTGPLVVGLVFLAVLVVGLRAIKRQRDQGRRSKLPPIG